MKFVALISGGKDSVYAAMQCVSQGHELICLANLRPPLDFQELNSYMYQSAGAEMIESIAECIDKPLIRRTIVGKPVELGLDYKQTTNDEVEDLFELLKEVKFRFPEVTAVSSGAILSTYQKNRVEAVCGRLGLVSLAPLWKRDQEGLLTEMVSSGVNAVLVRVATYGLYERHLGKSIGELHDYLIGLQKKHDCHCCGEGGEFESLVLDSPLYRKRIELTETSVVVESKNELLFSGRLAVLKHKVIPK